MTKYLTIGLLLVSQIVSSQALRDINYDYIYNPGAPVSLDLEAVRGEEKFAITYRFSVTDTTDFEDRYAIVWEIRQQLSDKDGTPVEWQAHNSQRTSDGTSGIAYLPLTAAPSYLVAMVINKAVNRAWMFYVKLDDENPVNNFLVRNGHPVTKGFVRPDDKVAFGIDTGKWMVFYYGSAFPAAAPAFSEAQAPVSVGMSVDSVFAVNADTPLQFVKKGLYLAQKDTIAIEGMAFRVEDDYPQYSRLANLVGPLVYITTRNEYDRLEGSRGNKRAFDRVILAMTGNTERARILMRNYFRRVELANQYFTSYKEGWKTDRGMVYIIFGIPNEVYRFDDREVWEYKNNRVNERFVFVKSGSIFDPDNFVLIRQKKREELWYEIVDLWRKARF